MLKGSAYFSKKSLNQNYYEFIKDIMEDRGFPVEERELFWSEFAVHYMNDVEFRYQTHGKYILFHNNKYVGVVDSKEEGDRLFPSKIREYIYIGDDKIHGRAYSLIKYNPNTESIEDKEFVKLQGGAILNEMNLRRSNIEKITINQDGAILNEMNLRRSNIEKITMDLRRNITLDGF